MRSYYVSLVAVARNSNDHQGKREGWGPSLHGGYREHPAPEDFQGPVGFYLHVPSQTSPHNSLITDRRGIAGPGQYGCAAADNSR